MGRQAQLFQQRHDIDAARLQHRALCQVDLVQAEEIEPLAHDTLRARQEARADTVGDASEPEVEARRLDLVDGQIAAGDDLAVLDEPPDRLGRQDTLGAIVTDRLRMCRFACVGHSHVPPIVFSAWSSRAGA